MKNIHIHRDTYYISFSYDGKKCFALINSNEIDMGDDNDKPCVVVNSHGIPTAFTKKELLSILKEDKTTSVKQYTVEQYLNDEIEPWEAEM